MDPHFSSWIFIFFFIILLEHSKKIVNEFCFVVSCWLLLINFAGLMDHPVYAGTIRMQSDCAKDAWPIDDLAAGHKFVDRTWRYRSLGCISKTLGLYFIILNCYTFYMSGQWKIVVQINIILVYTNVAMIYYRYGVDVDLGAIGVFIVNGCLLSLRLYVLLLLPNSPLNDGILKYYLQRIDRFLIYWTNSSFSSIFYWTDFCYLTLQVLKYNVQIFPTVFIDFAKIVPIFWILVSLDLASVDFGFVKINEFP